MRADIAAFLKFCRKNQLTSYRSEDVDIPKSATRKEKRILQPEQLKVLFFSLEYIHNKQQAADTGTVHLCISPSGITLPFAPCER